MGLKTTILLAAAMISAAILAVRYAPPRPQLRLSDPRVWARRHWRVLEPIAAVLLLGLLVALAYVVWSSRFD